MGQHSRDELADLAPSGKLVYKVLEYNGPLTQKQLVEETMLSGRTVRSAVSKLEELGVVTEDIYLPDARQDLYKLTSDWSASDDPSGLDRQSEGGTDDATETCSAR